VLERIPKLVAQPDELLSLNPCRVPLEPLSRAAITKRRYRVTFNRTGRVPGSFHFDVDAASEAEARNIAMHQASRAHVGASTMSAVPL